MSINLEEKGSFLGFPAGILQAPFYDSEYPK